MELGQFGSALKRRIWIALALTAAVLLVTAALTLRQGISYTATTTLVMNVKPAQNSGDFYRYADIYTFQAGEYLLDDFSEIVRSQQFDTDLRGELGDQVKFDKIAGERLTKRTHRLLSISVTGPSHDDVKTVANAVAGVISKNGGHYLSLLESENAEVQVVDPATVELTVPPLRIALDFALRGLLAFVLGIGIILLLEYLDRSIRDREDAERLLGLSVLGEIPTA